MKIAIIGCGSLGSAVANSYSGKDVDIVYSDPNLEFSVDIETLKSWNNDAFFICVPTPEDLEYYPGKIDHSIVRDVLFQLRDVTCPVIVKSTVMPSLWRSENFNDNSKYFPKELFHIPEIVTSFAIKENYLNTPLVIIGKGRTSTEQGAYKVIDIIGASNINPQAEIVLTDCYTSSVVKYIIDAFLLSKTALMYQFYLFAKENYVDWDDVVNILKLDPRMGTTHFDVLNKNSQFGYHMPCFPKDINAMLYEFQTKEIDLGIITKILDVIYNTDR
ncbi:MAG: hypothetical protein N2235_05305 [Fischerella sp.]|nr:hypothetical protein [Fischerella sp.]